VRGWAKSGRGKNYPYVDVTLLPICGYLVLINDPLHHQMELPVPSSRRYHSVFACPVSKEQATETNPPKMLSCGHAIAQDSLTKLSKHGYVVDHHPRIISIFMNQEADLLRYVCLWLF
jgi:hypothetical protein